MIIEIKIPDETYEQYNRSPEAMAKQLVATVNLDTDPKLVPYYFDKAQLTELRQHFGPNIKNAEALLTLIKRVGTIRLQKAAFQMDSDQIEQTVIQAYFTAEADEPGGPHVEGYTKAQHAKVVQRYVKEVLQNSMNYILGLA